VQAGFFFSYGYVARKLHDAIDRYKQALRQYESRSTTINLECGSKPERLSVNTTAEAYRERFYNKDWYRQRIRETLNWPIVWLAAANDGEKRKETLNLTVWDFLESALWNLNKITDELLEMNKRKR